MDAIIGKYKARIEKTGLLLNHPTGISFDLTLTEAIELMEFIKVYQAAIINALRDAEPGIEGVVVNGKVDNNCNYSPSLAKVPEKVLNQDKSGKIEP